MQHTSQEENTLQTVFADRKPSRIGRNEPIPTSGVIHRISTGHIGLYCDEADGRRLLFLYRPGDIVPLVEQSDVFPDRNYLYTAMDRVELRTIPREEFRKILQDPTLGREMMMYQHKILQLQMDRINNLQGRISVRLLERLVFTAYRVGNFDGDKVRIDMPMSHVDMAATIGTSRETVNRMMKRLEADKLLSIHKQRITIPSLRRLEEMWHSQRTLDDDTARELNGVALIQMSAVASSAIALLSSVS